MTAIVRTEPTVTTRALAARVGLVVGFCQRGQVVRTALGGPDQPVLSPLYRLCWPVAQRNGMRS